MDYATCRSWKTDNYNKINLEKLETNALLQQSTFKPLLLATKGCNTLLHVSRKTIQNVPPQWLPVNK